MTTALQLVQTIAAYGPIAEINDLERRIVDAEDDADSCRWQQAALVVQQLQTMSQRDLAAQWINQKTGKPYAQSHVGYVARAFEHHRCSDAPRPTFREAYRAMHRPVSTAPKPTAVIEAPAAPARAVNRAINTPDAAAARVERSRAMADEGYSVDQIAAALHVAPGRVRHYARKHKIKIHAACMEYQKSPDPNRIVDQMAMDADNLTAAVGLIDFSKLDQSRLPEWIASFAHSQAQLRGFIRKLREVAHETSIEIG